MGFTFEEFPNADYYRSDLRQVLRYVRSLEAYVKTWDDVIAEIRADIHDLEKIPELEESVNRLWDTVDLLEESISNIGTEIKYLKSAIEGINEWRDLLDTKVTILADRVNRMKQYVDDMDAILMRDYNTKFYIYSTKMNQMKIQLMSYINGIIERMEYMIEHLSVDVRDPIEDTRITFDANNMNIYNRLSCGCITQEEFAEVGLTEAQFETIGFTQLQFALDSARVLRTNYIFAPISGVRKSHEQAIAEVVTWFCGTMTEAEFETLNLTEEEFAALNLTHEQYLRYNNTYGTVVVSPEGSGLTENQYQHLDV